MALLFDGLGGTARDRSQKAGDRSLDAPDNATERRALRCVRSFRVLRRIRRRECRRHIYIKPMPRIVLEIVKDNDPVVRALAKLISFIK